MSRKLIDHSPDLKKLWREGYWLLITDSYLLVKEVPYLKKDGSVGLGILVSYLHNSGERTLKPDTHVAFFIGELPCKLDGTRLSFIIDAQPAKVNEVYQCNWTFSAKDDYSDYYQKISRYVNLISAPAFEVDPTLTAKKYEVFEEKNESVFNYPDTNSAKAAITATSAKLKNEKVAIIGVGGTGSYILDLIAKTPVTEIHLYDADHFCQHNAFRAPGAADKEVFYERIKKTDYFKGIYSSMHKNVLSHPYNLTCENLDELQEMSFVFISMDSSPVKKLIVDFLLRKKIQFIDTGLGIEEISGALRAQLKVTTGSHEKVDHVFKRISIRDLNGEQDIYDRNIQIADLNSLCAVLAVIKWKKIRNFYHDLDIEHFTTYVTFTNEITNDDLAN